MLTLPRKTLSHSYQHRCEKRQCNLTSLPTKWVWKEVMKKSASLLLRRCEKRLMNSVKNCPTTLWKILPSNNHWMSQWLSSKICQKESRYVWQPLKCCPNCPKFQPPKLWYHVKNPGPISLPSWSVFDQGKALSFNIKLIIFLLFYNNQQFKYTLLICYDYALNFGCSSMSFLSQKISTCNSNKHNTPNTSFTIEYEQI